MSGRKSEPRRITKRVVDAASIVWDSEVTGLGVRRQKSASRVYVLKARIGHRQRWFTIGRHGSPWTPELARKRALEMLADISKGEDLGTERDHADPANLPRPVRSLSLRARPRSQAAVEHPDGRSQHPKLPPPRSRPHECRRRRARGHRSPQASDQSRRDRKGRASRSPSEVHRARWPRSGESLPGSGFEDVSACGTVGLAPRRHQPVPARRPIFGAAHGAENPYAIAAICLLLFTGARLGEILRLRWDQVDYDRALINLEISKTGRKTIYLSAPALQVMANLPRLDGNPHVIAGGRDGGALADLERPWRRVREAADIEDVRLHDLRHSFASTAADGRHVLADDWTTLGAQERRNYCAICSSR